MTEDEEFIYAKLVLAARDCRIKHGRLMDELQKVRSDLNHFEEELSKLRKSPEKFAENRVRVREEMIRMSKLVFEAMATEQCGPQLMKISNTIDVLLTEAW